jgi:hypothetical protein
MKKMGVIFNDSKGKKRKAIEERRLKRIVKILENCGSEISDENIDYANEMWDSTLDDNANAKLITKSLKEQGKGKLTDRNCPTPKEMREKMKELRERQIQAEEEQRKERQRKYLENINIHATDLDHYYSETISLIKTLITPDDSQEQDDIKGIIVESPAGLGKTTVCNKELGRSNLTIDSDYGLATGHITPLRFYVKVWNFKDKLIVFDDVGSSFDNYTIRDMFLGMLGSSGEVYWDSSSDKLVIPDNYQFVGKMIYLTNEIPKAINKDNVLSRCIHHKFDFRYDQKIEMMYIMASQKGIPKDLVNWLHKETSDKDNAIVNNSIDFRTLNKLNYIYRRNKENWKIIAKGCLFGQDDLSRIMLEILTKFSMVLDQEKEWKRRTGRTDFYSKKREFEVEIIESTESIAGGETTK